MADECIFCRIVSGESSSYKIWEDKDYIAILDIFPNINGQTLVVPKTHTDSNLFAMPVPDYTRFLKATRKVAKLIEKKLKVNRVHIVLEGTAINHLHAKLYPAIGYGKDFAATVAKEKVKFDNYPGYVTTLMGPRASDEDLAEIRKKFVGRPKNKEVQ